MLRLIGILTGSAIAIGTLIIALGLPELSSSGTVTSSQKSTNSGTVTVTPGEPDFAEPPDFIEPEPAAVPAQVLEDKVTVPEPTDETDKVTVPYLAGPSAEELIEQIFSPAPEPVVEENWYAFWSPFRSELAAKGFVAKLQETTGIDYRVVKVETGVYEVAFAYADDADIQDKLARISSATGLDMSGG